MKIVKLIIISLLFLPLVAMPADESYKQSIRGRVIDKTTQTSLPGATVIVLDSDPMKGTTTDAEGYFKLEEVPVGRKSLKVSYVGYKPITLQNLLLQSGKEMVLTIELEQKVITTEEVEIKAEIRKDQPLNDMATVSARSFTVEETNRYAGTLGDPSRMVASYAGVNVTDDSRNDIIIRGNSPMGLLWRLDGINIPNPNHFGALGTTGGPVTILNNNLLTNSDFYTGAFPAEYGDALAGAFDLQLRSGNNEQREYTGQVGFNGFELGAEGPFSNNSRASYLVNYRYSTLEVLNELGINFAAGSSIPEYQDMTFKIDVPGTRYGRFSLFGIGGMSHIKLYDSEKEDDEFSYGLSGTDSEFGSDMGAMGLNHVYFFNDHTRLKSHLALSGTRNTSRIDSLYSPGSDAGYPFLRSEFTEVKYTAGTELFRKFDVRNNMHMGFTIDHFQTDYIDSVYYYEDQAFRDRVNNNGDFTLLQAYAQWQHKFTDEFTLNTGLHYQQTSINDDKSIEPRLGLKWQFAPTQSLSLAYGRHAQTQPHLSYFTLTKLDDGSYISTNEDVEMTRSNHYVLGYDWLMTEKMRLKVETYYQSLSNVPVKEQYPEFSMLNAGNYFAIPLTDSLVNKGTGYNYGVEFTVEKFFSKGYYFLLTTSLFDSKYEGYDKVERNTAFNSNYVLNGLGGYEFRVGEHSTLSIDMRAAWAGGNRYTPIDLQESITENNTQYLDEQAFAKQYDDYFSLDTKITFRLNGKKVNQEWALDIKNITDHQNIFREYYNPLTQSVDTDYQQGIFPMMLYRIQF